MNAVSGAPDAKDCAVREVNLIGRDDPRQALPHAQDAAADERCDERQEHSAAELRVGWRERAG